MSAIKDLNQSIKVNKVENGVNIHYEVYSKKLDRVIKIGECPRCEELFDAEFPALSRKDNKTKICSECGTSEALEDWMAFINKNNFIKKGA